MGGDFSFLFFFFFEGGMSKFSAGGGTLPHPLAVGKILVKSTQMYYVLSAKILQGADTATGTVLQKRCSRICG